MIYLDTSVALAHLLAEDRQPPDTLWKESLVSSRLLEYEMWVRVHARSLTRTHGDHLRTLLGRIAFMDLSPHVLARALDPFPTPVRTLDALHLASADFLRSQVPGLRFAAYDERMITAARRLGLDILELEP